MLNLTLGNFTHFLIGALALIKAVFTNQDLPFILWVFCGIYVVFAIAFSIINFTHPLKE